MKLLVKTVYWLLVSALIAIAATASIVARRSRHLETMIADEATRQGFDPVVFIALVEKCSSNRTAFADHEHYGLLALTADEGRAWAAENDEAFDTFDLFDPEKNLRIGAWKFGRMLRSWSREKDPRIWALAEWRSNHESARKWAASSKDHLDDPFAKISDPNVRMFVMEIIRRTHRDAFKIILPWKKES